eukprot:jgi/Chlat1/7867/Chrsp66S07342
MAAVSLMCVPVSSCGASCSTGGGRSEQQQQQQQLGSSWLRGAGRQPWRPMAPGRLTRAAGTAGVAGTRVARKTRFAQAAQAARAEAATGDLMHWMLEQGMPPAKIRLEDRAIKPGEPPIHVCIASEDLKAGDVVLRIPDGLIVTLERVFGDETLAELLTTNSLSELACLALYMMYEKKSGAKSFWSSYIKELDRQRARGQAAVESPLLWKEEELYTLLAGSPVVAEVENRLAVIEKEYQELDTVWFIAGSLFQKYPYDIPTEAFSLNIFKQAFVAVQSCVVHLQNVNIAKRFALVPLGPPFLAYSSTCRALLKHDDDDHVSLTIDRPYKAGEPISVWCGPQPNAKLLLNYGFVDPNNPYDRLVVETSLPNDDPLFQKKRLILQHHGLSTVQTFQLYRGKESDAVEKMLTYMRFAHASDADELSKIDFADGPVCLRDPTVEKGALLQLKDYVQQRLSKYPRTLEEDEALLRSGTVSTRERVATQLVSIEKGILLNTLADIDAKLSLLPAHVEAMQKPRHVAKLK